MNTYILIQLLNTFLYMSGVRKGIVRCICVTCPCTNKLTRMHFKLTHHIKLTHTFIHSSNNLLHTSGVRESKKSGVFVLPLHMWLMNLITSL